MALTKITGSGISDIAAAVEGASDSNKFTDADHTKLNAIEASATTDQTKSDVESLGIDVPAANLTGTVAPARLGSGSPGTGNFLRGDGSWQTAGSTSASDLTSGTLADARFPSTLPAISGANLTGITAGGPSLGTNSIIRTNAQTINENITIGSTTNGMSAGPITIADTKTVTVNGNWSIV